MQNPNKYIIEEYGNNNKLPIIYPIGVGLYLNHMKEQRYKDLHKYGKLLKDNYITWIAIGGPWYEKNNILRKINNFKKIKESAKILSEYTNIFIWGYPYWDSVSNFIKSMRECTDINYIKGWILDAEIGFKNRPTEAHSLVFNSISDDPYQVLGMTTYGALFYHHNFPIQSFRDVHFGSPQVYNFNLRYTIKSFKSYNYIFKKVIPSFSLFTERTSKKFYPKTNNELKHHINVIFKAAEVSDIRLDSMIGWQDDFVRTRHYPILKHISKILIDNFNNNMYNTAQPF